MATLTRKEVTNRVKKVVHEQLGVDMKLIVDDANYVDDFGADSLDSVELLMEFEEEFGISIPEDDADKLDTVSKTIDYLCKALKVPGQTI